MEAPVEEMNFLISYIRGGEERAEMEKDAPSAPAACANFSQLCYFLFVFHAFY